MKSDWSMIAEEQAEAVGRIEAYAAGLADTELSADEAGQLKRTIERGCDNVGTILAQMRDAGAPAPLLARMEQTGARWQKIATTIDGRLVQS